MQLYVFVYDKLCNEFLFICWFQGGIIINKLDKDAIDKHVKLLREQFDNLELFLKESKFMAGDKVIWSFVFEHSM